MSNNSNLVPRSFFFTDPAAISQSAEQIFGPLSEDQFRITAKFSVANPAPAFAVCTGTVLVQPQTTDGSRVNLVLRPFKQPVQGLNIRYFVYRGLQLSDFFSNGNVSPVGSTSSDLIARINADFDSYYSHLNPGTAVPEFKATFIGYDPEKQVDSTLLSDLFFKRSTLTGSGSNNDEAVPFELPLITAGASLGNFKPGECGFEVVLAYGDYSLPEPNNEFRFDLAYARASEKIIDLSAIANTFKKKQTREQIFQFLDPAAYFGFHSNIGGEVTVSSDGVKVKKTGQAVYNEVIQNFRTKNNLYLYIRSDRSRSYNFYENYGISDTDDHSMLWGYTETGLTPGIYGNRAWPLLIDNSAQAHNNSINRIYLQLVTDNNNNAMLYGQAAQIENAQGNNFCGAEQLRQSDNSGNPTGNITQSVILMNPNVGPDGAKLNIATFNILLYQGVLYDYQQDERNNSPSQPSPLDDLFELINASLLFKTTDDRQYSVITNQKIRLVNHYDSNTQTQYGISAVQTVIVDDLAANTTTPALGRVTYMTDTVEVLNNAVSITGSLTADTQSSPALSGSVSGKQSYQLPAPFYYALSPFTDNGQLINGLLIKTTDGSVPGKMILGLTRAENDLLKTLVSDSGLAKAQLILTDVLGNDDQFVSMENIRYKKYLAGISGETSSGELKAVPGAEPLSIYSLDKKCFFSADFAAQINQEPITSLSLDLEISL